MFKKLKGAWRRITGQEQHDKDMEDIDTITKRMEAYDTTNKSFDEVVGQTKKDIDDLLNILKR